MRPVMMNKHFAWFHANVALRFQHELAPDFIVTSVRELLRSVCHIALNALQAVMQVDTGAVPRVRQ